MGSAKSYLLEVFFVLFFFFFQPLFLKKLSQSTIGYVTKVLTTTVTHRNPTVGRVSSGNALKDPPPSEDARQVVQNTQDLLFDVCSFVLGPGEMSLQTDEWLRANTNQDKPSKR